MFGKGISWADPLIDAAVKYGIIDKKGSVVHLGRRKKWGRAGTTPGSILSRILPLSATIEKRVRELIFSAQHPEPKEQEAKASEQKTSDAVGGSNATKLAEKLAEYPSNSSRSWPSGQATDVIQAKCNNGRSHNGSRLSSRRRGSVLTDGKGFSGSGLQCGRRDRDCPLCVPATQRSVARC